MSRRSWSSRTTSPGIPREPRWRQADGCTLAPPPRPPSAPSGNGAPPPRAARPLRMSRPRHGRPEPLCAASPRRPGRRRSSPPCGAAPGNAGRSCLSAASGSPARSGPRGSPSPARGSVPLRRPQHRADALRRARRHLDLHLNQSIGGKGQRLTDEVAVRLLLNKLQDPTSRRSSSSPVRFQVSQPEPLSKTGDGRALCYADGLARGLLHHVVAQNPCSEGEEPSSSASAGDRAAFTEAAVRLGVGKIRSAVSAADSIFRKERAETRASHEKRACRCEISGNLGPWAVRRAVDHEARRQAARMPRQAVTRPR